MALEITAPQVHRKHASANKAVWVSFAGQLNAGELITSGEAATELTTSDLTIANVAVNASTIEVNGKNVIAGQAIVFTVDDGVVAAGTDETAYTIRVSGITGASPAQDVSLDICLIVEP